MHDDDDNPILSVNTIPENTFLVPINTAEIQTCWKKFSSSTLGRIFISVTTQEILTFCSYGGRVALITFLEKSSPNDFPGTLIITPLRNTISGILYGGGYGIGFTIDTSMPKEKSCELAEAGFAILNVYGGILMLITFGVSFLIPRFTPSYIGTPAQKYLQLYSLAILFNAMNNGFRNISYAVKEKTLTAIMGVVRGIIEGSGALIFIYYFKFGIRAVALIELFQFVTNDLIYLVTMLSKKKFRNLGLFRSRLIDSICKSCTKSSDNIKQLSEQNYKDRCKLFDLLCSGFSNAIQITNKNTFILIASIVQSRLPAEYTLPYNAALQLFGIIIQFSFPLGYAIANEVKEERKKKNPTNTQVSNIRKFIWYGFGISIVFNGAILIITCIPSITKQLISPWLSYPENTNPELIEHNLHYITPAYAVTNLLTSLQELTISLNRGWGNSAKAMLIDLTSAGVGYLALFGIKAVLQDTFELTLSSYECQWIILGSQIGYSLLSFMGNLGLLWYSTKNLTPEKLTTLQTNNRNKNNQSSTKPHNYNTFFRQGGTNQVTNNNPSQRRVTPKPQTSFWDRLCKKIEDKIPNSIKCMLPCF